VTAPGPIAGLISRAARVRARLTFHGSAPYWERRYAGGGTSGTGSYGPQAQWKADVVNAWVRDRGVRSVVDLGCGDGNQLGLADYPRYLGLDVSPTAIRRCIEQHGDDATKSFMTYDPKAWHDPAGWTRADLALSMEVIFHLVEDDVRDRYLQQLFASADRFVVICARDSDLPARTYEHHRPFTPWIAAHAPGWELVDRKPPPAGVALVSDLFLYARIT
jgi:SAM-dependent methyltransferase